MTFFSFVYALKWKKKDYNINNKKEQEKTALSDTENKSTNR